MPDFLSEIGALVGAPSGPELQMAGERNRAANQQDLAWAERGVSAIPVIGALTSAADRWLYNAARHRIDEGRPEPGDHRAVAWFEERERRRGARTESWPGYLGDTAARLPAIAGEGMIAGAAMEGLAAAAPRALGWLAPAAGEAAPSIFTYAGVRHAAGEAGRAAISPAAYGRTGATTLFMPSMYAEDFVQRGGRAQDLPPAFALGALNAAVLGSVARLSGAQGIAAGQSLPLRIGARAAVAAPLGVAEQAGADIFASAVSEILPESMRLSSGYGLVGDVLQGRGDRALMHAVGQALTFSAFSVLHGGVAEQARGPIEAATALTTAMHRQGMSARAAGEALRRAAEPLLEAINADPNLSRAQALAIADQLPAGRGRDFARSLATTLPEHAPAAGPEPGIDRPITTGAPAEVQSAPGTPTTAQEPLAPPTGQGAAQAPEAAPAAVPEQISTIPASPQVPPERVETMRQALVALGAESRSSAKKLSPQQVMEKAARFGLERAVPTAEMQRLPDQPLPYRPPDQPTVEAAPPASPEPAAPVAQAGAQGAPLAPATPPGQPLTAAPIQGAVTPRPAEPPAPRRPLLDLFERHLGSERVTALELRPALQAENLPEAWRRDLLSYLGGKTLAEVGGERGVSAEAARKLIEKAAQALGLKDTSVFEAVRSKARNEAQADAVDQGRVVPQRGKQQEHAVVDEVERRWSEGGNEFNRRIDRLYEAMARLTPSEQATALFTKLQRDIENGRLTPGRTKHFENEVAKIAGAAGSGQGAEPAGSAPQTAVPAQPGSPAARADQLTGQRPGAGAETGRAQGIRTAAEAPISQAASAHAQEQPAVPAELARSNVWRTATEPQRRVLLHHLEEMVRGGTERAEALRWLSQEEGHLDASDYLSQYGQPGDAAILAQQALAQGRQAAPSLSAKERRALEKMVRERGAERTLQSVLASRPEAREHIQGYAEQLRQARLTPVGKEWDQNAREAGIEPDHLHQAAAHIAEHDRAYAEEHNAVLRRARDLIGGDARFLHLDRYQDPESVRGFDQVVATMEREFPGFFAAERSYEQHRHGDVVGEARGVNNEQRLWDMLKEGNRQPLGQADAYRQALDYLSKLKPTAEEITDANRELRRRGYAPLRPEEVAAAHENIAREATEVAEAGGDAALERGASGAGPEEEVAPGVFFHKPGAAAQQQGAAGTGAAGRVGPFEINATIDKLLQMRSYVDRVPGGSPEDAAYLARQKAAVIGKMAAGDAQVRMHEAAHHISIAEGLPLDPNSLPPDVVAGFKEFDYVPNRKNQRVAMQEGFAEFLRRRQIDDLTNLSPAQQAAADYAQRQLDHRGYTARLDRIRELFRQVAAKAPDQQAAGLISTTGQPAEPQLTRGEQTRTLAQRLGEWFQDNVDTNLGALLRMSKDAVRRGYKAAIGQDAYTVYSRLMYADKPTAGEFEHSGVWTLKDGKKTTIGQSLDQILEPLHREDLAPFQGDLSRFDVYAVARHVLDEAKRGRAVVPEDQRQQYERAMQEFQKDPQFVQRAEEAARRLTAGFNATLDALSSPEVHYMPPALAQQLKDARPTYVPTERVLQDAGWQSRTGVRGERMREMIHARSGSGEQIVSPIISYKKRLAVTAALFNEQLRRNAVAQYLLSPGMGDWALPGERTEKLTPEGRTHKQVLENLGMADHEVAAILKDLGGQVNYFQTAPWPTDGTKPTWWWRGPDGKPTNFRIGDRALYDLITGQQGDANSFVSLIRGVSNLTLGGLHWPEVMGGSKVRPFADMASLVRKGATAVSLGFQLRNIFPTRDPYEFIKNTIDQASARNLPEFYGRAYAAEIAVASGKVPKDVIFKLYQELRGEELRKFAFDRSRPGSVYSQLRENERGPVIRTVNGSADFVKRWLAVPGAGENAPRALEFRNFLEQAGYPEAKLKTMAEKGESVPFFVLQAAMNAAAEVTVPFSRQGVITRELNQIHPFFGPAIAGMSKAVRNWRTNAKGAAIGLAGLLSLRLLHWALFHKEDWWTELSAHDRYANFVVPVPGMGLIRLPGARDLEVPVGGAMIAMLDGAAHRNPDFAGLVRESIGAVAPPAPITPAVDVGQQLLRNRNWMGSPIVPRADEHMSAMHNLVEHQAPYALHQLTGGRGDLSVQGAGVVPFTPVRNARRSVDELYEQLHALEGPRTEAVRRGVRFPDEREYQTLRAAEERIRRYSQQLRGLQHTGRGMVQGPLPNAERQQQLREAMLQIAQSALRR